MEGKNWHDKYYKVLLLIPAILVLFSIVYLGIFHFQTGDFFEKDITLTGGTSVTLYDDVASPISMQTELAEKLEDLNVRSIYDFGTREQKALIIETPEEFDKVKLVLEDYLGYEIVQGKNADVEFTGSSLSESFYKQLLVAILVAFVFMALVVFLIFRNFVPSAAVILSAFADILMTLVLVDILGIKMSSAGIIAFIMLIGYSVDTDILLTTRILRRREGTLNEKIFGAFKPGITMTLTSFFAIGVSLVVVHSFSVVLSNIFTILVIGLGFDLVNTWITNVSILKWHVEKKEKKK